MRGEPDAIRAVRLPSTRPAAERYALRATKNKVSDLTDAVKHLKIVGKSRVVALAGAGI